MNYFHLAYTLFHPSFNYLTFKLYLRSVHVMNNKRNHFFIFLTHEYVRCLNKKEKKKSDKWTPDRWKFLIISHKICMQLFLVSWRPLGFVLNHIPTPHKCPFPCQDLLVCDRQFIFFFYMLYFINEYHLIGTRITTLKKN